MARRLGISSSYLNLIEHDQRAMSASLLLKLAREFDVDLRAFASGEAAALVSDVAEVFSDPLFGDQTVGEEELRELAISCPDAARAVRRLYQRYLAARDSTKALAEQVHERQDA